MITLLQKDKSTNTNSTRLLTRILKLKTLGSQHNSFLGHHCDTSKRIYSSQARNFDNT